MDFPVECTHCRILMTSWSAPGSPVRYYQCPFCARTFSSAYGEVFRHRAGARRLDRPAAGAPASPVPLPTPDEIRWRELKRTADRWFARLEAEERRRAPAGYALASVRAAGQKR
ncbi:MAG TPA: hypothetical protein VFF02_08220 [Anaeromyxobacteraceae bacterium]|nr:hypothetical protein [Anaeromyxobacteraceae bacterium]